MNNTISAVDSKVSCYHCGNDCKDEDIKEDEKHFCCSGCFTVYDILKDNNLCGYYDLNTNAGISLKSKNFKGKFNYLAEKNIEAELLSFHDEHIAKVILNVPSIHCSSCVWLLENFPKILKGVISARLNFVKKELALDFDPNLVSLKEIVELMTTLGYEPQINLESTGKPKVIDYETRRLLFKIGVTGFCAGNIMMMSFPEYFNLDLANQLDATYQKFFLYFNFILALPVFFYGASDYLKGAYYSIVENSKGNSKILSVDIPIALGISALFLRSTFQTLVLQTAGYWDSMAGLVLFLLVGKWVQKVTFNYLSFDRSFKSYFPLAVKVKNESLQYKNVNDLAKGDIFIIHHQELIPTDAVLLNGNALIDYSFVTGEAKPIKKLKGETVFAGGRQVAEQIELLVQKPVSTSYLTQLWNNESFLKEKKIPTTELANAFSKYFTYLTISIAILVGIYWKFNDPSLIWPSVTAVLMVACPCALTLSLPFTMNATMSIFGKNRFFVKNQGVIQQLSEIDTIVFDKTGTLTEANKGEVRWVGDLNKQDERLVYTVVSQSVHPLSKLVASHLSQNSPLEINYIFEVKGQGIEAIVAGISVKVGRLDFVNGQANDAQDSEVHVSIADDYKGFFTIEPRFRPNWKVLLANFKKTFELALLSGDNNKMQDFLKPIFGLNMRFNQTPQDKLDYIKELQSEGNKVLMIGDGLNDAGALRESKIGIALTEDVQAFSPSCDAILDANKFENLAEYVGFSKTALNIVKLSFLLSVVYNIIGVGWAASGNLSPVLAAIFMPLSTLSVVFFAVGLTWLMAHIRKLI
ncbi:HAD family hydrolase [Lacihabitans sp. CCS-44]|uniref:heavy metal translocating P-type ATPase n=1 Tax=Lacihabitans sp. CCS-44 TaxID=2487331 RepID=UPI0020CCEC71|nr:heavy metal translocating P-type ATPase metal-binding domain-containing protein [Lacihabitans sp. CCS-44]MCP9755922.1 HAD family hydrolase [Lacihabitans sp. CCS-44]